MMNIPRRKVDQYTYLIHLTGKNRGREEVRGGGYLGYHVINPFFSPR